MLKRIYIDNYKSLVNFDLTLNSINLFLGSNGSGKSTVFEVIYKLWAFLIDKQKVTDLFSSNDSTRWQNSLIQFFEIVLESSEKGEYIYKLEIEQDEKRGLLRVKSEQLLLDNKPLLDFQLGEAKLYRDDGSSPQDKYPFDWSQSAIASLPSRADNTKLTFFKRQIEKLIVIHPIAIASLMSGKSTQEERYLKNYAENFASWYRYLSSDQRFIVELTGELREIITDFDALAFDPVGKEERLLKANFRNNHTNSSFEFDELSDGQRMLIVLYTLLHLRDHRDSSAPKFIICLDEPENFVALREIQPWLKAMYESCQNEDFQLLLISHHPEVIDYLLLPGNTPIGYWFERANNMSPSRPMPISPNAHTDGLPVSELVARGWLANG